MRVSLRGLGVVLAAAVVGLSATACSSGASTAETSSSPAVPASSAPAAAESPSAAPEASAAPQMWYINVLTSYDLYNQAQKLFEDSASKLGYESRTAGSPTVDIPGQITLLEQAIASGAKAIVYCDLDPKTYGATVKKAQDAGIVMVTTGGCVDEISDYSIGTDNKLFGQAAADTIAKGAGEDAQVVVFGTNETVPNQVAQLNAFKEYAASKYPNMKVVSFESTDADAAKAASKIAAATTAYPEANAYWFIEGAGVSAVPKSLEQAGKKPGDIFVLGIDSTPETLASVEKGWVSSTLAQCFFYATPFAADLALKKLNGAGPAKQSWDVGVVPVGKADLPFAGCPDSVFPTVD